jgi:hypothetical protein
LQRFPVPRHTSTGTSAARTSLSATLPVRSVAPRRGRESPGPRALIAEAFRDIPDISACGLPFIKKGSRFRECLLDLPPQLRVSELRRVQIDSASARTHTPGRSAQAATHCAPTTGAPP